MARASRKDEFALIRLGGRANATINQMRRGRHAAFCHSLPGRNIAAPEADAGTATAVVTSIAVTIFVTTFERKSQDRFTTLDEAISSPLPRGICMMQNPLPGAFRI